MFRAKFGKDGINVVRHYFQKVFHTIQSGHHRPASDPIVARQCVLVEIALRETKIPYSFGLVLSRGNRVNLLIFLIVLHKKYRFLNLSEN